MRPVLKAVSISQKKKKEKKTNCLHFGCAQLYFHVLIHTQLTSTFPYPLSWLYSIHIALVEVLVVVFEDGMCVLPGYPHVQLREASQRQEEKPTLYAVGWD